MKFICKIWFTANKKVYIKVFWYQKRLLCGLSHNHCPKSTICIMWNRWLLHSRDGLVKRSSICHGRNVCHDDLFNSICHGCQMSWRNIVQIFYLKFNVQNRCPSKVDFWPPYVETLLVMFIIIQCIFKWCKRPTKTIWYITYRLFDHEKVKPVLRL